MLYFFISFVISVFLTFLIKKFAYGAGVVDTPDASRHLHAKPTPLLGGLAIFLSFWATDKLVLESSSYITPKILSCTRIK